MKHKYLNKQFTTTSGQTGVVIKYVSFREVYFKFDATGWVGCFSMDNIRSGKIKDKMSPSLCGVGFIGDGEYKPSVKGKFDKAYISWSSMIKQCYDKKTQRQFPVYIGCTVSSEWHNYQNYASWYYDNLPDDGKEYRLSRSDAIHGDKVFSPENCRLLTVQEIVEDARAKLYKLISPYGKLVDVYNLNKFCKENGLNYSAMHNVSTGRRKSCKGWTKA
jgi:hypothetical protein